jgi:hypothetical protein
MRAFESVIVMSGSSKIFEDKPNFCLVVDPYQWLSRLSESQGDINRHPDERYEHQLGLTRIGLYQEGVDQVG